MTNYQLIKVENLFLSSSMGNVLNPADRWNFGMQKMGYDVTSEMMPNPGGNYKNVKLQFVDEKKER